MLIQWNKMANSFKLLVNNCIYFVLLQYKVKTKIYWVLIYTNLEFQTLCSSPKIIIIKLNSLKLKGMKRGKESLLNKLVKFYNFL